jgi:hypothetical protein
MAPHIYWFDFLDFLSNKTSHFSYKIKMRGWLVAIK